MRIRNDRKRNVCFNKRESIDNLSYQWLIVGSVPRVLVVLTQDDCGAIKDKRPMFSNGCYPAVDDCGETRLPIPPALLQ